MINKIILVILLPIYCFGQNTIGLPYITNFYKSSYNAGIQNWDIKQDKNEIVYLANNEGLLSFDGKYWNLYPLPNKTIVRSIEIGADNNIYVGGQDEFGYFSPGKDGKLSYKSLIANIPQKDRAFGDVWDIVSIKENIFFRTVNKIFKITNYNAVSIYISKSEWSFMGICNGQLFASDYRNGLMKYENNNWNPISDTHLLPQNDPVTAIFPLSNEILLSTLKNGLFKLKNNRIEKITSPIFDQIQKYRIYACIPISNNWMAIATNIGGVFIVDIEGKLIQKFSIKEGLQNNNILSILLDNQSNLWLGLDNGIDCIAYNSAIKHISPSEQNASGYASIIYNNALYIGTSGGLFKTELQNEKDLSFSKGIFEEVSNTTGQTWGLAEINGKLLLGHHEGAFVIDGNNSTPIAADDGFWNFTPLSSVFPSTKIVAGNYKGLSFFEYKNNRFTPSSIVPDFIESSRYVALDKFDNIWVSHPYHGVYKITETSTSHFKTQLYTDKNGLPFKLNNQVYKIKNQVVVATDKGIYIYNPEKDIFEQSDFYRKILGDQSIRYLKDDNEGNIWFIHEKNLGVIDLSDKEPKIIFFPELNNKMLSGFECIYPVNSNNIFLGGESGFYHINYEKYKKNTGQLAVRITTVKIHNQTDSTLFGGYFSNVNNIQFQDKLNFPKINHNWKDIHFEYSTPIFGQETNLLYSYRLKGFDKDWSEWSKKTEKDYTNLSPGNYSFEIKVRNNLNSESAISAYGFQILHPWYRNNWAYSFYFLLLLIGFYYLFSWQRKKFFSQQEKYEDEQKKLHYLHQLEINKAETELVNLRNEKLQNDIDFKNSELATSAMHLVQKGEILAKIKTELNQIMKAVGNEKTVNEMKKMIKVLGEDEKMDKDWEHFAQHFDKVHSDFVGVLKETHSNITPNELKLCIYLRMNLSTKEIAQLMNISVRGIEISRYRLRKKLGITTEISLFDYLINLSSKPSK
ncbi:MAG: triple tyrosine motif-containing protein [Bacteroidota bacterium]